MKKQAVFVLAIALAVLPTICYSEIIVIETATHHLGDEILGHWGLFSEVPEPEGVIWTSDTFDLASLSSGSARVIFDCVNTEGSFISVNGTLIGEMPWYPDATSWHNDQTLDFDSAHLLLIGNTITFESQYDPEHENYDDMLFRNVRLEYVSEPAAGLIAYWSFDDSGDPGHDDSGNDHDGTVNGAVSTDGICGKALSFDGLNDYVEVPDDDTLDPTSTQEITIAAWVKISTYQSKTSSILFGIVGKISSPTRPVGSYVFGIVNDNQPTEEGKLRFGVCYDGLHWQDVYSNSLVPKNRWVHLAVTHDINQNTKFFIDGRLNATDSSTITTDFENNDLPLRIGHTNSFWDYFYGSIDEVRIYDRALSESEIGELAAECPPEPDIEVSPLIYDFGNVEIGLSETMIVTISNVGNCDLNVSGIALETDFAITSAPAAAIVVEPSQTVDVEITYTPTVIGDNSAVLKITSNDPDEPVVEVQLSAAGVEIPPPPSEQIANILAFFDTSVNDGSLVGDGPGNSAEKRLNALRNMVEAAGDLIDNELSEEACQQLLDVYRRMDDQPKPPDFVTGEAVPELASKIQDLMTSLGCE